jgi:hypothetical protein
MTEMAATLPLGAARRSPGTPGVIGWVCAAAPFAKSYLAIWVLVSVAAYALWAGPGR